MNKKILPALLLAVSAAAFAGKHAYGPFPAVHVEECGSCHVAYPPQLLTAPGWQTLMDGLDKHYGSDASLDANRRIAIADFLRQNASRRDKHAATTLPPRLTQTAWFRKEHGNLPEKATPTLPAASQCDSCHLATDCADYDDAAGLKLPAGYKKQKGH